MARLTADSSVLGRSVHDPAHRSPHHTSRLPGSKNMSVTECRMCTAQTGEDARRTVVFGGFVLHSLRPTFHDTSARRLGSATMLTPRPPRAPQPEDPPRTPPMSAPGAYRGSHRPAPHPRGWVCADSSSSSSESGGSSRNLQASFRVREQPVLPAGVPLGAAVSGALDAACGSALAMVHGMVLSPQLSPAPPPPMARAAPRLARPGWPRAAPSAPTAAETSAIAMGAVASVIANALSSSGLTPPPAAPEKNLTPPPSNATGAPAAAAVRASSAAKRRGAPRLSPQRRRAQAVLRAYQDGAWASFHRRHGA